MNSQTARLETGALVRQLEQTPASKRREVLMQHLSTMLRDLLPLEASERFRPEQRLFELGLQSRNVVELKDRLETTFAVGLPVTLFFQQVTLEMLTTHLLTTVLKLAPQSQTPPPRTLSKPVLPTSMVLEQLEHLSEAEAEAQLLDKLTEVHKRIEP